MKELKICLYTGSPSSLLCRKGVGCSAKTGKLAFYFLFSSPSSLLSLALILSLPHSINYKIKMIQKYFRMKLAPNIPRWKHVSATRISIFIFYFIYLLQWNIYALLLYRLCAWAICGLYCSGQNSNLARKGLQVQDSLSMQEKR